MGRLKQVIASDDGAPLVAHIDRLLVTPPGGQFATAAWPVYLQPNDTGSFMATCREIPDVVIISQTDEEVLDALEQAMCAALNSPDQATES